MSRRLSETQSGPDAAPRVAPKGRGANAVLSLQRMAGNRAVAGLMRSPTDAAPTTRHKQTKKLEVAVVGEKQGAFKGTGHNGAIEAYGFHMSVVAPKDAASGAASGKRIHKAITFKKPLDGSSPQFLTAIDTNEVLTHVTIRFVGTDSKGSDEELETVTLTNASLASFDQDDDDGSDVETVSLTYEKLEMSSPVGKTSSQDEWDPR
jgi:type VI secretion system secreted protein Hcp